MSQEIVVNVGDQQSLRFPIGDGVQRLGSGTGCEMQIAFEEVSEHAASIERRGGAVMFQNLNPYVVYLGTQAVAPQAWVDWRPGDTIQMTRSVVLELHEEAGEQAGDAGEEKSAQDKARSTVQIAVICGCALAGWVMLANDSGPSQEKLSFDFQSLVAEFENGMQIQNNRMLQPRAGERQVMQYLQEAWTADTRWASKSPELAIDSYELLINHRLVRNALAGDDERMKRIHMFAESRLDALGMRTKADIAR